MTSSNLVGIGFLAGGVGVMDYFLDGSVKKALILTAMTAVFIYVVYNTTQSSSSGGASGSW